MYCRNCGAQIDDEAQFCTRCGAAQKEPAGPAPPPPGDATAPPYAASAPPPPADPQWTPAGAPPSGYEPKQRLIAGLLGILLGSLGIHRFYLGYNTIGAVQLVLGLSGMITCGMTTIASAIWGIIDGVMILTGAIRTDARGIPLRD